MSSSSPGRKPVDHSLQDRPLHAGQIQSHDQQIEQTGANGAERLVASRTCLNFGWHLSNAARLAQFAIKVRVLEERLIRVTADGQEIFLAAKQSAIAEGDAKEINAQISDRI